MPLSQEDRDNIDPQGARERQAVETAILVAEELTDLNPNVEMDAKEFGEHVRNGGWRLGLLVARNVQSDAGHGARNNNFVKNFTKSEKISGNAFARQAGKISAPTVNKYLNAWNMAAADGHVPASSSLSPGQEVDFSETDEDGELILTPKLWDSYFKPKGGDNEPTVLDFFKGLKKYTECNLHDWLTAENFEGQDFVPQDVYDLLRGVNRISAEGMQIMSDELAEPLGLRVINESGE